LIGIEVAKLNMPQVHCAGEGIGLTINAANWFYSLLSFCLRRRATVVNVFIAQLIFCFGSADTHFAICILMKKNWRHSYETPLQ
jgi:hypothetical protein